MRDCNECRNCLKQIAVDLITMFEDKPNSEYIVKSYFETILKKG